MVAGMSGSSLGWSTWTISASTGTTGSTGATIIHPADMVTEVTPFRRPERSTPAMKPAGHLAGKLSAPASLRGEPARPEAPKRPAPPSRPAWAVSLKAWQ